MPQIKNILKGLQPVLTEAVSKEAGLRTAQQMAQNATRNIARNLNTQHLQEMKQLESEAAKLIQGKGITGITPRKFTEELIQEWVKETAKEQLYSAVEDVFSESENIDFIRKTLHLARMDLPSKTRITAKADPNTAMNLNTAVKTTNIPTDNIKIKQQLAEIRKIDPTIISDLNSFLKQRITELSAALITTALTPADIQDLSKEIDELSKASDKIFSALDDPQEFCRVSAVTIGKFFDLSKERKTLAFRDLSPKVVEQAEQLEQRLTIIKNALR